jgi:hypothetical protein
MKMRKKYGCITVLLLSLQLVAGTAFAGSFAPAAGQTGSGAIHMDDTAFVAWATGWENYIIGTGVDGTWQTPDKALGKAVGTSFDIVCLGNGGQITMTFGNPIVDGSGADFAVFENSFNNTFLELGYVEVSADGSNWYRFTNYSTTVSPVGGYGSVDPTDIYQLGSKYIQGYGEGYDLAQLDLEEISYVRILDIIGDGSNLDSVDNPIYDPTPTWGSGGFDLDAIGVINQGAAPVPLPGSCLMLLSGLIGMVSIRQRTREA